MTSNLSAGVRWFFRSGIQHPSGAVRREYRAYDRAFGPYSAEAGGWYVLGLLGAADGEADEARERAEKAGEFLVEQAIDLATDLVVEEPPANGEPAAGDVRFGSCLVALRALTALWKASGETRYLGCAERCARALQTRMSRVDGSFFSRFDLQSQEASGGSDAEIDQARLALALFDLAESGGYREFEAPAIELLSWALGRHEAALGESGPFVDRALVLRRYARFLEGLLPRAAADARVGQTLQSGIMSLESEVAGLPADRRPLSLSAQALRLRLHADSLGIAELDRVAAERETAQLSAAQLRSEDPRLDGGFPAAVGGGDREAVVSAEETAVSLQALAMWTEAESGAFSRSWQDLI